MNMTNTIEFQRTAAPTDAAPRLLKELGSIQVYRDPVFENFFVIDLVTRNFETFPMVIAALSYALRLQTKKIETGDLSRFPL